MKSLEHFVQYMPDYWSGCEVADPVVEMARLEAVSMVQRGLVGSIEEVHLWTNGCSFRSRHLLEPNPNSDRAMD